MAIARYYVQRLFVPNKNSLAIRAPDPWKWARVRGANADGKQLADISLSGGEDAASLVVRVTDDNSELAKSRYEIVLGDADTPSDHASLRKTGQEPIAPADIKLDHPGYERMDRDPPPPPGEWHFDWDFGPAVVIG
ncbi:MAG: hypothetical protein JNL21_10730 [Myxococcales bacterium]|nr:hypothetical protein [Myxococcales bacterium]